MSFTHLHVHSTYSFLDGASRVDKLAEAAKHRQFEAMAITDHGVLYGWPEFQLACEREGIQPILGVEAYMVKGSYADVRKQSSKSTNSNLASRKEAQKQLRSPYHQLLLAMNDE